MNWEYASESLRVCDLGLTGYEECLQMQRDLFGRMVDCKKNNQDSGVESLILVEHPAVITLGRHAVRDNVLLSREVLGNQGIEVFETERGGDVTYHGPGQLVAYPILDLERHRLGIKDYVSILEESVIRTIAHYGIMGERIEGASGVWIGKDTLRERKICALGVKCSRYCTMHGLALNVNTDLNGFSMINPCGFIDKGVTSIAVECAREVDMDEAKKIFTRHFLDLLGDAT